MIAFVLFSPKTASEEEKAWDISDTHIIAYGGPNLKPRSDIEALIISKAIASQVSPELLLKVARCESGFKPNISNPRSTASGLFQFLDATFLRYAQAYELSTDNKNDPSIQAELAAKMIADGGLHHWNASRSCWESSF